MANRKITNKTAGLLKGAMFFLAAVGTGMVVRTMLILSRRPSSSPLQPLTQHDLITLFHIVPGALFMLTGPLQFMPRLRARYLSFHRWSGRVFAGATYLAGMGSILLAFSGQLMGGIQEAAASVFFSVYLLVCISRALMAIAKKQVWLHREWMIRTFSLGLAIVTIRLITVIAFIAYKVPRDLFIGTGFWMGFSLHAIVAELWICYTRHPAASTSASGGFAGSGPQAGRSQSRQQRR